jgi:hypothetical protein
MSGVPSSSESSDARRPAQPRPARKSGEKPIRLTDLIPKKDVKGGGRTVFGAAGVPPRDHNKAETDKGTQK